MRVTVHRTVTLGELPMNREWAVATHVAQRFQQPLRAPDGTHSDPRHSLVVARAQPTKEVDANSCGEVGRRQ